MLVWVIFALILHEETGEGELHKSHHSRAAGVRQRLAALKTRVDLIATTTEKQNRMEETLKSNHLNEKNNHTSRERTGHEAINGCLRLAKQITIGSTQAEPCEETTSVIKTKLPEDTFGDEQWNQLREEGTDAEVRLGK